MSKYRINRFRSAEKIQILTDADLEFLFDLVRTERQNRKKSKPKGKKPSAETPTVRRLGDPDGDVLWKHHGVTELEAYNNFHEL